MRLHNINEDSKITIALWIAEKMLIDINCKDENYDYCKESIDLCWEWLINRNLSKNQIVDRVSNNTNISISKIVLDINDIDLANQYGAILMCISYIAWQAYNYEKVYSYPQDLECVNDEYLEELINELIEEETILDNQYKLVVNYIINNHSENNKTAIKKYIIDGHVCHMCKYTEQCEKIPNTTDNKIKYIDKNDIICVNMRDYHYYFLYKINNELIYKYQITQEEFEKADEWINDIDVINHKKNRTLGCDICNEAVYNPIKKSHLIKKGDSPLKQAELYICKECGTYWEYGVYKEFVVDASYAEKYYF